MMDQADREFLATVERALASAWRLLAHREQWDALWCITYGKAELGGSEYDNWNGGTWYYDLIIRIDPGAWVGMQDRRDQIGEHIADATAEIVGGWDSQVVRNVKILPSLADADEGDAWRTTAAQLIDQKPVNNQGRIRSDSIAPYEHRGLRFRSPPEIELFKAFERMEGVLVAPLPAVIVGGAYKRFEPDFLVFHRGKAMIVEVDGATTHPENVTMAHDRIAPAARQNIHVERVPARRCMTFESAEVVANELIEVLNGLTR